mmetsp:Transcript_75076/g.232920  ORF Transcript_75076/g.232920 Transcript_75076/m.232920 type:complete len:306 (+) Transcript_75076:724-1641(+)
MQGARGVVTLCATVDHRVVRDHIWCHSLAGHPVEPLRSSAHVSGDSTARNDRVMDARARLQLRRGHPLQPLDRLRCVATLSTTVDHCCVGNLIRRKACLPHAAKPSGSPDSITTLCKRIDYSVVRHCIWPDLHLGHLLQPISSPRRTAPPCASADHCRVREFIWGYSHLHHPTQPFTCLANVTFPCAGVDHRVIGDNVWQALRFLHDAKPVGRTCDVPLFGACISYGRVRHRVERGARCCLNHAPKQVQPVFPASGLGTGIYQCAQRNGIRRVPSNDHLVKPLSCIGHIALPGKCIHNCTVLDAF